MRDTDNTENVLDIRELIERIEELRDDKESFLAPNDPDGEPRDTTDAEAKAAWDDSDEAKELTDLESFVDQMKGYGGDHKWEGDWYPSTLIRDSYFQDYAEELAEEIGAINSEASWPNNCIDWEKAARDLQVDYSTVEFDGVTYWYR